MSTLFFCAAPFFEKSFPLVRRQWTARPCRDVQQTAPAWICPRCGEEQYHWDETAWTAAGPLCARCAGEEEGQ